MCGGRYANRAKNIKNKPKINEDPKDALLREFQEEIARLKAALDSKGGGGASRKKRGRKQPRTGPDGLCCIVDELNILLILLCQLVTHELQKSSLLHFCLDGSNCVCIIRLCILYVLAINAHFV